MPEPSFTTVGGWLYDALRPVAEPYDADRGYPLAVYADGLGGMLQPVLDIVDDPSRILDPDRTPADWLPWLGQFVGAGISGGRSRVADRHNYVRNPSVEVNATDLAGNTDQTGGSATPARITTDAAPGGGSASAEWTLVRPTGTLAWYAALGHQNPAAGAAGLLQQAMPVTPGQTVYLGGSVKTTAPGPTTFELRARYHDVAGAFLTDAAVATADASAVGVWTDLAGQAVVPAGAVTALVRIRAYFPEATAGVPIRTDRFWISEGPGGYFDGGSDLSNGWLGVSQYSFSAAYRDETDDELRARLGPVVKSPPRSRRGTVPAIVSEVQAFLAAPQTVFINERVGGDYRVGSIAILAGQRLPGVAVSDIQARVDCVKPGGRQITVSEITPTTWQAVRDTHASWSVVRSTFTDWGEVRSNPTKQ